MEPSPGFVRSATPVHPFGGDILGTSRADGPAAPPTPERPPPRGLRARLRRNPLTRYPYRVLVALTGAAVVAVGIVLLPLPGPGWLIIFAGVGIWATEFRWAAALLRWLRRQLGTWARWTAARSPFTRVLITLLLTLTRLAAVAAGYVALRGVPSWVPASVPLLD